MAYPRGVDPADLDDLSVVNDLVTQCRACPRLVEWRERVAEEKRAAFADWDYWGRPVPGFGDRRASIVVVGLAPAAHGANRTGRMFTGDRSGDFLYAAMHRVGLANQPTSEQRGDGLELEGVWVTAPVRCAPPSNKPTPEERDRCRPWFEADLRLVPWRVAVALGSFGYAALARSVGLRPRPSFGHGVEAEVGDERWIVCSYHVSQQNTFTGKLTEDMFDDVLVRAKELAGLGE